MTPYVTASKYKSLYPKLKQHIIHIDTHMCVSSTSYVNIYTREFYTYMLYIVRMFVCLVRCTQMSPRLNSNFSYMYSLWGYVYLYVCVYCTLVAAPHICIISFSIRLLTHAFYTTQDIYECGHNGRYDPNSRTKTKCFCSASVLGASSGCLTLHPTPSHSVCVYMSHAWLPSSQYTYK